MEINGAKYTIYSFPDEIGISLSQDRKSKQQCESSDSDSDTLHVDGEKVIAKKKTASQWVIEVERDNKCNDHVSQACVKLMTGHHQLTKHDLGTWGMFLIGDSL